VAVQWHREAFIEWMALPPHERDAVGHAVDKLAAFGDGLRFPHSSGVRGNSGLRELRPRAGASAWRVFYRRNGASMVVGAVGPEARVNPTGFKAALLLAEGGIATFRKDAGVWQTHQ